MTMKTELSLSPYMTVKGAAEAIEFYKSVFGAEELFRLTDPGDGRVGHAELRFGQALLMVSDEYPDFGALGPEQFGGSPVKLHVYVADVDSVFARALELGATELRPVKDQFYGDRTGMLVDPFGHTWSVSTRQHEISAEQMQRRWNAAVEG
jgi:PhnB protein